MVKSNTQNKKQLIILDSSTRLEHLPTEQEAFYHVLFISDDYSYLSRVEKFFAQNQIKYEFHFPKQFLREKADELIAQVVILISRLPSDYPFLEFSRYGNLVHYSLPYEKNAYVQNFSTILGLSYFANDLKVKYSCDKIIHLHDFLELRDSLSRSHTNGKSILESLRFIKSLFFSTFIGLLKILILRRKLGKRNFKNYNGEFFYLYYPYGKFEEGKYFRSNYLKDAQERLEKNTTFIGIPLGESIKKIGHFYDGLSQSKNKDSFFDVFELISIPQYLFLLLLNFVLFFRLLVSQRKEYVLNGVDFSSLINRQLLKSFSSLKIINALAVLIGTQKIKGATKVTYLFENYGWERALCYGLSKDSSGKEVIAYQHYAIGKNHLNLYRHHQLTENYLPQKLGVIGEPFAEILEKAGWPREKMFEFETYRYTYLKGIRGLKHASSSDELTITVLFSISTAENIFLVTSTKMILDNNDLKQSKVVKYRCHPAMSFDQLKSYVPEDWQKENDIGLSDLLRETDVVICGPGGVALEALLLGCVVAIPFSNRSVDLSVISEATSSNVVSIDEKTKIADILKRGEMGSENISSDFFY